ncbi:MAG: RrF2 family transcriptional regulator [Chthoniobacterales bacterium]
MKLSKKSEYALRAMLAISRSPGSICTIPKISRTEGIPAKFLEQILLVLRQKGLLESKRGAGGGYFTQRTPGQISVLEIVEAVEGPFESPADNSASGGVDLFLRNLHKEVYNILSSNTIDNLIELDSGGLNVANFEI